MFGDLVSDCSHLFDRLSGGVGQFPIEISLSRIDGTGVATPHRDHHIGRSDYVIGQGLGKLLRYVDAYLGHSFPDTSMYLVGGCRSSRTNVNLPPSLVVEECGCHLRTPRIVDAYK